MSKKTIVIRHHHEFINNFDILPKTIMMGAIRILRVYDPSPLEASIEQDFDVLITADQFVPKVISENFPVLQLPRYDKFDQHQLIQHAINRAGEGKLPGFRPIKTYRLEDPRLIAEIQTGKVVFKHPDGARGLGQIVVDLSKVGLFKAVTRVKEIMKIAATATEIKKEGGKIDMAEIAKKIEEIIADSGLILSHGSTKFDYEWVESLSEIGIAQEVVEEVVSEWRVITDIHGVPTWIQQRSIGKGDFPTATGSDGFPNRCDDAEVFNAQNIGAYQRLVDAIDCMDLKLNSIDLFFTIDGKWGFFEFCNQWGISGVNPAIAKNLQEQAIVHTLVKHDLVSMNHAQVTT